VSEEFGVESILSQAREQERVYDWLRAAESYKEALGLVSERDFLRMSDICERLGYAFYRAAMQGETADEFGDRMRQAIVNYEKAKEFFARLSESGKTPRTSRCDAMIAYLSHWLTSEVPEKRRLLNECWRLTKEALRAFEKAGDAWEFGKTYNQLLIGALLGFFLEWDYRVRESTMKEALEHGERAIAFLSTFGDPELTRAYVRTAVCLSTLAYYFLDQDEKEEVYQKAKAYILKAEELSEETASTELLSVFGGTSLAPGVEGSDEALRNLEKALEYGRKTKDRFIIGCALDFLAYHTFWKTSEDPDERITRDKRALQYAEDAKHHYSPISFVSVCKGVGWVEAPYAEYYWRLASNETNLGKRRELLEKALEASPDLLKRAENSGCPENVVYAHHASRILLISLAEAESNPEEKRRLLEKALVHGNESFRLVEQIETHNYWDRGIMQSGLASIKYELAGLAEDPETKKDMIQEALLDLDTAEKLCIKGLAPYGEEAPASLSVILARGQYNVGVWLNRLYEFTKNVEHLRKAIEAFREAAESYQKFNVTIRVAECYWKIAQTYDNLYEHLKAAENFDIASGNYKKAAEKIPQLKDFYQDHALYMQAWSEIEKARHHHARQEYGLAEEHFDKAANLHQSLKQWSYLAPNYSAWAQVEHAEESSRKEQSEEAIQAFEQATKLFDETKKSLQTQLSKIENPDEKQMATSMLKATGLRHEYCIARIALEEAKILDKKGDHYSSSEKYGSAAQTLEKIVQALDSEQERKEFKLIINLSHAWQKMTRAEAEASPALYTEASQLFEEAKEFSPSEKTKMLVLGHSRFCRALEAGTKFADTREIAAHTSAIKYLESAANYYVNAGFQKASEYAKATRLLFDAYVHMDNAKEEKDPEKRAKLYMMAEKVLQTSAGSYMKAEHPEKRERVLRLLEEVKEERELAMSLTEVFHAPSIVSATIAFPTPAPTHEEAVGLEKFENADIQANIITRQRELKVGENLDLEIELVNAGKGPALLIKVVEVIPEGFELTEKPEIYRVEDSYLNMKGKRLDPLKTEEIRLVLKPKVQGAFELKPKVLYLDENGKYKSHEPEPITITVKELGIKGWLKGER